MEETAKVVGPNYFNGLFFAPLSSLNVDPLREVHHSNVQLAVGGGLRTIFRITSFTS